MNTLYDAPLSARAYAAICDLVYKHSRIRLGNDKQPLLANRLRSRLAFFQFTSYDEYCDFLQSLKGQDEIGHLIDLISTNHTKFFREPEHFTYLSQHILPALLPRLREDPTPLRIWSAACSSGEEPYTLAVVLAEFFQLWPSLPWEIIATDISGRIITKARQAIYRSDAIEPVPADLVKRYFQRGTGPREGSVRVKTELTKKVHFQTLNLFDSTYPLSGGLEVIFCRNVMIYFDVHSREVLLQKLTSMLAPGGTLFVGKAESLFGIPHSLQSVQQGVYRKG